MPAGEIVALLVSKGLVVKDKAAAAAFISTVGYSRLLIYLQSRRNTEAEGKPFKSGTTFEEIIAIYQLDARLRAFTFPACAEVEILFRNAYSEVLTERFGPHPYTSGIFKSDAAAQDAMRLLSELYYGRLGQDRRARHYFRKYRQPTLPPIWTLKEFFTFEKSSRFFNTLDDEICTEVSKRMGFAISNHDILKSWIKAINDLRNVCAHHDRLFNRAFQKQPQNYRKANLFADAEKHKLAGILKCVDFLTSDGVSCFEGAKSLISASKYVSLSEAGFK